MQAAASRPDLNTPASPQPIAIKRLTALMVDTPSLKIRETERCDWHDSQLVGESPTFAP